MAAREGGKRTRGAPAQWAASSPSLRGRNECSGKPQSPSVTWFVPHWRVQPTTVFFHTFYTSLSPQLVPAIPASAVTPLITNFFFSPSKNFLCFFNVLKLKQRYRRIKFNHFFKGSKWTLKKKT
jgi:hypothetical protein